MVVSELDLDVAWVHQSMCCHGHNIKCIADSACFLDFKVSLLHSGLW